MISKRLPQYLLAVIILLTLIIGVLAFIHPPGMYPDPSWGFQVIRSMQMGGGFNLLISPDPHNIAQNISKYTTWWSPGQYLVPYLFISMFKLNMASGATLTSLICSLLGITGFYALFRRLGFSLIVSSLSVAFIFCQLAYFIPYVFYNGGEVVLFAFEGWFLYGCVRFEKAGWQLAIFLFVSGIIGFICKSAFIWIYFAGALYLWISLSPGKKMISWIKNGLLIGVPAILALATIYFTFLSKGDNPAAGTDGFKFTWQALSFPVASPLLAGFSIDDITEGIVNYPLSILIALALLSIALVIYICKVVPSSGYKLMLTIIYLVAIVFFSISFLRQTDISYEARHLRIIGLLITPGIIYAISNLKRPFLIAFALIWLFIAFKSFRFIGWGLQRNSIYTCHGRTGISMQSLDQATLDYLTRLDNQERNALFVFINPDAGLEIAHNRVITFSPLDENLEPENDLKVYEGHAGPIYLVVPKTYAGAKAAVYMKSFPGYLQFSPCYTSKYCLIYKAQ